MSLAAWPTAIVAAGALAFAACGRNTPPFHGSHPSTAAPAPSAPVPAERAPSAPPADVAAPPADATRLDEGLAYRVVAAGAGDERPGPEDVVLLHYSAWTPDGALLESTRDRGDEAHFPYGRGEAASFPMARVIQGWRRVLPDMRVGERRLLWVPAALAYEGQPGRPQSPLLFDVELISITPAPRTPDPLTAPATASRAPSGLAWVVLRPGEGARRAGPSAGVRVHYSVWTAEGRLYDSSVPSGIARTLRLDSVAPGLAEAIRSMAETERRRVWIPAPLAYPSGGGPEGDVIYDLELLSILD